MPPVTTNNVQDKIGQAISQVRGLLGTTSRLLRERRFGNAPVFNLQRLDRPTQDVVSPQASTLTRDIATDIRQTAVSNLGFNDPLLNRESRVAEASSANNQLLQRIAERFGALAGKGERTATLEKEAGIATKTQELDDIQNKILLKERQFNENIRRIDEDQTLSIDQKNARISSVEREQARELADLSIIEQTKLKNLSSAQALVDRKIELEFSDIKTELEGLKFFYSENKEILTKEEDRQFELAIKRDERAYNAAVSKAKSLEEAKLDALKTAGANGAPNEVLERIMKAETPEQAFVSAGQFISNPLEIELLREKILTERFNRAQAVEKAALESGNKAELKTANTEKSLNIARQVSDLLNDPAFNASVGFLSSKLPSFKTITGQTTSFDAKFDQLKNSLTIDNLKLMSGVLSESDIQLLASAATRLRKDMPQKDFKAELEFINQKMSRSILENGITEEQAQFYGLYNSDEISEFNSFFPSSDNQIFNPASFYSF